MAKLASSKSNFFGYSKRSCWPTMNKKMWIPLLLVLFCIAVFVQYDEHVDENEDKWLRRFVADPAFADEMQSLLGNERAEVLASEIDYRLDQICRSLTMRNATPIPVYVITPTYRRPDQIADLTRFAQTLMHVPNMYWMLVEDAPKKSPVIANLWQKHGIRTVHLLGEKKPIISLGGFSRGPNCRNRALTWIRKHATNGVFYFADDDNAYSIPLFEEIRKTKRVSMFPVGLGSRWGLSSPIVKNGTLIEFYDWFHNGRKFRIDMAGFAVNVEFFKERPKARMRMQEFVEEESFLQSLAPFEPKEAEMIADNCTKILVWHTKNERQEPQARVALNVKEYKGTNLVKLEKKLV